MDVVRPYLALSADVEMLAGKVLTAVNEAVLFEKSVFREDIGKIIDTDHEVNNGLGINTLDRSASDMLDIHCRVTK